MPATRSPTSISSTPRPVPRRTARASRGRASSSTPRAPGRCVSTSRAARARGCRGRTRAPRRSRRRSARSGARRRSSGRAEAQLERCAVVAVGAGADDHGAVVGVLDHLRRVVVRRDHHADRRIASGCSAGARRRARAGTARPRPRRAHALRRPCAAWAFPAARAGTRPCRGGGGTGRAAIAGRAPRPRRRGATRASGQGACRARRHPGRRARPRCCRRDRLTARARAR